MTIADEIDFEIKGGYAKYVEIELDPNETAIAEAGAMLCMDSEIEMNTIFGDGTSEKQSPGIINSLLGAGKRLLTGESLFMTAFTNIGHHKSKVTFAAPYPGEIIPIDLTKQNGSIICQSDAFLCAARGVAIDIYFQRNIMSGIFGGEGFILQKIQGNGLAFIHAGGSIFEKELKQGESIKVDTGSLVAFQPSVNFNVRVINGIKNALFGGEDFFLSELTGPGKVWVQSMSVAHLAAELNSRGSLFGESGSNNNALNTITRFFD